MPVVTMQELLQAGIHFGHQTRRWNPRMAKYIFGQRNGIYIIDLQKTLDMTKKALAAIEERAARGEKTWRYRELRVGGSGSFKISSDRALRGSRRT